MNTTFLLLAQYGAAAVTVDRVRSDYFGGMTMKSLTAKLESGEIPLPVSRLGSGAKAVRMVSIVDLAAYLDAVMETARKEMERKR